MDQFLTVLTIYAIGAFIAALPFIARWWTRAPKTEPARIHPRIVAVDGRRIGER